MPGLKVYADKPEIVEQPAAESLLSRRIEKWAIIPQTSGELTLPALELSWFDTVAETYRVASLPSQVINVLPQVVQPGTDANAGNNSRTTSPQGELATTVDDNNQTALQQGLQNSSIDNVGVAGQHYWKTLALAAIAAWLLSSAVAIWFWWRSRGSSTGNRGSQLAASDAQNHESAKAALRQVDKSVKSADSAATIAAAVLGWAARRWPQSPPQSL